MQENDKSTQEFSQWIYRSRSEHMSERKASGFVRMEVVTSCRVSVSTWTLFFPPIPD